MDAALREALDPILRDLRRAGLAEPAIQDRAWTDDPDRPSAMMRGADGSGSGVSVERSAAPAERIADVADQVQEWAIEDQLWGAGVTNWPRCCRHPDNHPMQATTVKGSAVWVCPATHDVIAAIGAL